MQMDELIELLGYAESPNFLTGDELAFAGARGHVFRQAREECALRGVYVLRSSPAFAGGAHIVPLVYVCDAHSEEDANQIHRLVWNQDVVPFLIVRTPRLIRLYTGFRYQPLVQGRDSGILEPSIEFNRAADALGELSAAAIDQGRIWERWGHEVNPRERVDWRLLDNLGNLGALLRRDGMPSRDANALIGKYVYLQYLRQRHILSDRKLAEWGLAPAQVFSRRATLKAFQELCDHLHEWLNGSVFPLPETLRSSLTRAHLQLVAGVFAGDAPGGQLHLAFEAYDFSFIPIETLSVIYEQFLHAQDARDTQEEGPNERNAQDADPSARDRGAYYTPIPVVDFMIEQMEARRPLQPGMRVLDPSCGSGAFLVQCYRRLVEGVLRARSGRRLRPTEVRELLTSSIFGVDSDHDACQVAELSLILTLLDYVDPPDLSTTSFQLPALRERNLFCCDAFDEARWASTGYEWIVGNPPWSSKFKDDSVAGAWLARKAAEAPIGGNQLAEAFAWRACELVAEGGIVGFLMPAMTLFKDESRGFREALFRHAQLFHVTNFANLTEVLFAGRARDPAAALFFAAPSSTAHGRDDTAHGRDGTVLVYTPFIANQEANRPRRRGTRVPTWSFVINTSELRELLYSEIASGESMPWKLAMWGSPMDGKLLGAVNRAFPTLGDLESEGRLVMSQGLELRPQDSSENIEHHPELARLRTLRMEPLKRLRDFFSFPSSAIAVVAPEKTYVRKGRYALPIRVCSPPHVIVSAARTFAIYSDEFLIVPPRQIGIAGRVEDRAFLKALSLYLSADFVYYQQILTSTIGIKRPRATLQSLRDLPVAIASASEAELRPWITLHDRLVRTSQAVFAEREDGIFSTIRHHGREDIAPLLEELNALAYDALGLDHRGRALVHDLVHVKMELDDGKTGKEAIRAPSRAEMAAYASMLRRELDEFLVDQDDVAHNIVILTDGNSGMLEVALVWSDERTQEVALLDADDRAASELRAISERLIEQRSQWVYHRRDLRIYDGDNVYLFKPMQRIHWTPSQALIDAGEIIAETLIQER